MSDDGSDLSALDEAELELAGVDAALRRLDAGTYGSCEVCSGALDAAALEAAPLLRRCRVHA